MSASSKFLYAETGKPYSVQETLYHFFSLPIHVIAQPSIDVDQPAAAPAGLTEDEQFFHELLSAFGQLRVTDRARFIRELNVWLALNVRTI